MKKIQFPEYKHSGLTLLEILISLGILAVISAISWPAVSNIYLDYQMTAERDNLIAILRKAQSLAMSNLSPCGVYISAQQYIIFKGNSYAERLPELDEKFAKSSNINISGLSEIVFSALDGVPDKTGIFNLSNGQGNIFIQINEEGTIRI